MLNRPLKTYNGGKAGNGTFQRIINWIPKCEVFIDAMVGNGGIVTNLKLPATTVINDLSIDLIAKFNYKGQHTFLKQNVDYRSLIAQYDLAAANTFFYFDPPYLKNTRKSQQDLYEFEWTITNHEEFLSACITLKSNCMISHYPCSLYDEALKHWNKFLFQSTTRHGIATECIYMNYDTPEVLQDTRYIGENFTKRQQVKRQTKTFLSKLEKLPAIERNNLLAAAIEKFNYEYR